MPGTYAQGTTVDPSKSQAEIISTLRRYGAAGFMFGQDTDDTGKTAGMVSFRAHGRTVRFLLPLDIDREQFRWSPNRRTRRDDSQIDELVEGEHRRRWRSLALAIKSKLDVVETGISTFEEEFLAHIVLPDGSSVGQWVAPQLEAAYQQREMPKMLPAGGSS